ncbi:MAG TPA: AAA family ATPase [Chloroflexota bacterium]|nr:AAA family ATPase [Chloroflexota bacterium]
MTAIGPVERPIVGRADEIRQLADALGRAAAGQGRTVLLLGEAGIGKTRLAREILALARARRFRTLEGRAYPTQPAAGYPAGGLAYAPFLEALGPFLRALEPAEQGALVAGLPHLGRLFDGLRLPAPEPLGDAALEKTRLFESVVRLVERMARQRPLALFLDDLHWADPASLELLHYLARGLGGQPMLLLAAHRPEPTAGASPTASSGLRMMLKSLGRAGLGEELRLERLGRGAVAEMAAALLGGAPPEPLLDLLETRSGGTPLFVETLIQALIEAGQLVRAVGGWALGPAASAVLPEGIVDLLAERLERLDPADRRLVQLIAVYGEATPHAVLRAAGGVDEDALLVSLLRLRASGVVAEELAGARVGYALTHPLVREVVYADLPEMVRRRMHSALAAALERSGSPDLDRLARHYLGAGTEADQPRTLDVLLAAGERARSLHANADAARHLDAALALARAHQRQDLLPELLERLGEARESVGEVVDAITVWTEALALHEPAGRAGALDRARLRRRLAVAEWDRGDFERALDHLAAGLAALQGEPPAQELADLQHSRLILLMRQGDLAATAEAAADLVALAGHLDSPRAAVEAYLAEGAVHFARGDYMRARQRSLDALAAAEAADELLLAKRADDTLTRVALCMGDCARARQHAERSFARSLELGAPSLELYPRFFLVLLDLATGDWAAALQRSADALLRARRVARPRALAPTLAARGTVLAMRGDLEEAETCVAEARHAYGEGSTADRNVSGAVDLAETILALERGDAARARAAAEQFEDALALGANPPLGMMLLAEARVATGDPTAALEVAARLARLGPPDGSYPAALAARAVGLARRALGDPLGAAEAFASAADAFAALGMPFDEARTRLEWAGLELAAPADRRAAAQAAMVVFDRLSAQRYARLARRLLGQLGARPRASGHRPGAHRRGVGQAPLSPRELEVARLVAEGLTTAGIAERLVVSPRTVTTHLDNIYGRLGISSRAALVRYVAESGLLTPAS